MLKQILFCDAIPSYLKMSYGNMSYAILISLLRYCGDVVIQPRTMVRISSLESNFVALKAIMLLCPEVNFTNILRAGFVPISLCQRIIKP